jgi:hypothetical protein
MKKIIFKNQNGTIGIITPTQECVDIFGIEAIAKKDVPNGLPFWIVEDDFIPSDRTYRNEWQLPDNFRESDGYGEESNEF